MSQKEVQSPLPRADAYFVLGAVTNLIRRVINGNDPRDLTDLKVYLSTLTLPQGTTLEHYLSEVETTESLTPSEIANYLHKIGTEKSQAGVFLEGFVHGLRNKEAIKWYDYEDVILRGSSTKLSL